MMRRGQLSLKTRWAAVLVAAAVHPVHLLWWFSVVQERANVEIVVAPFAAVWLFNLRRGLAFLFINSVSTAIVFACLTNVGPREGLTKSLVVIVIVSVLCVGLSRIKRYRDQGREIEAEIKRLREPNL